MTSPSRPATDGLSRRGWLRAALFAGMAAALIAGCATSRQATSMTTPPIVFVHGNGDSAALWTTTEWRFESNGWPHDRLFAIDIPYPLSRDVDAVPQPGRSSTAENRDFLAAEVDRVLKATGASQVVLMANSRGGNAVRSYIASAGGAAKVSHAILCGTPNHGVWADPALRPGNEFNGAGPFLSGLNTPKTADGSETTPGPKWLTIRSDDNDKYAQPDGAWIGAKGTPTHVGFDGPALRGAENVVIPGIDHRETAFGPQAFEQAYRFLTGKLPAGARIARQPSVVLDGLVSGSGVGNAGGTAASNLPLVGAQVEVYATNPQTGERLGAPAHRQAIGATGRWGPFAADSSASYEFVIGAPGYATSHVYRSPFPRSSEIVHFRAERIPDAEKGAAAIVVFARPAGYFGIPRNSIALDGKSPPDGIPLGVAGVSSVRITPADATARPIAASFDAERIVGRTWPAANNELTVLELTY